MISLSMASYLTSYVYPLRLAIFHPQIYTFVDCNHFLSDTLGDLYGLYVPEFERKRKS